VFGATFVIGATLLGSILSLSRPYYGLLIYICFSILKPEAIWGHALPIFNYSRVIAIALLLGWMFNGFGRWQLGRAKPIVTALIGFWLWVGICTVLAPYPELGYIRFEETAKIVLPILVGLTVIETPEQMRQATWVIVITVGYVAYELNMSYFQGHNMLEKKGFGSMDNNTAGVFLVTGIGPAFFAGLNGRRWWEKAAGLGICMLLMHAVLFSFSRGAMAAACVTGLAAFILLRKRAIHYLLFLAVVALSLRLAGPEVRTRFSTAFAEEGKRDASAQSRIDLAKTCIDMAASSPVFGVGPDHFPQFSYLYGWPPGKQAHTTWLQAAAELGVPGFLLLVSFFFLPVVLLYPMINKPPPGADPWFSVQAQIVCSALVGFAVSAYFVSLIGLEMPYYLVMLGACGLKMTTPQPQPRPLYRTSDFVHSRPTEHVPHWA
jgi:probable O-glycosylation ligase (exosortase A-associated)